MSFKEEITESFLNPDKDTKNRRLIELEELIEDNTESGLFTFYRAEDTSEKPILNEDVGQASKGVYFAVKKEVAEMFRRSGNRSIFKFSINPNKLLKILKPIYIGNEDIELLQDMDPRFLYEILQEMGFRKNRYCVIIPMPDFGYEMQLVIPRKIIIQLVQKGYLRWEKVE